MASTASTATSIHTIRRDCTVLRSSAPFATSVAFKFNPRRLYTGVLNCSAADASVETTSTDSETKDTPVEAPKGPPSLISALNVEKALRGIPITDVDHYGRLGLQRECSYEEVTVAYKSKLDQVLNQRLDGEELEKQLEFLKESYSILSSMEERRLYDWSLARSENPDRYIWPFEVDKTPASPESPPPQEPEDVRPTVLVGYFMFGWLALAFTLSIVLNRS